MSRAGNDRRYVAKLKARVYAIYGESCATCGKVTGLTLDHVKGGGAAHRRQRGTWGVYRDAIELAELGITGEFQILCQGCNRAKGGYVDGSDSWVG